MPSRIYCARTAYDVIEDFQTITDAIVGSRTCEPHGFIFVTPLRFRGERQVMLNAQHISAIEKLSTPKFTPTTVVPAPVKTTINQGTCSYTPAPPTLESLAMDPTATVTLTPEQAKQLEEQWPEAARLASESP